MSYGAASAVAFAQAGVAYPSLLSPNMLADSRFLKTESHRRPTYLEMLNKGKT